MKINSNSCVGGVILIFVLMAIGIGIIFLSFVDFNYTWESFVQIFFKRGFELIIASAFVAVGLYFIFYIIKNSFEKEKEISAKIDSVKMASEYMSTADFIYIVFFLDQNQNQYFYGTNDIENFKENDNDDYKLIVKNKEVLKIIGKIEN